MEYEQLPDGLWHRKPGGSEYEPKPVRIWYMRDNHTFRPLPLDVEQALAVMREERDAGQTHGMLCGKPEGGVVDAPIHAPGAADWAAFESGASPWLARAVAVSKTPNVEVSRRGAAFS